MPLLTKSKDSSRRAGICTHNTRTRTSIEQLAIETLQPTLTAKSELKVPAHSAPAYMGMLMK